MRSKELYFEDVEVGMGVPPLVKKPTDVQLFRFSAVTWNSHRIHYAKEEALAEGYPDILVQGHLHAAFLTQLVTDWLGESGELIRFGYRNTMYAIPGDTLTCKGKVTKKYIENNQNYVELELTVTNQKGEICAPGTAAVILPSRSQG